MVKYVSASRGKLLLHMSKQGLCWRQMLNSTPFSICFLLAGCNSFQCLLSMQTSLSLSWHQVYASQHGRVLGAWAAHDDAVSCVAAPPLAAHLVTASWDCSVKIWRWAASPPALDTHSCKRLCVHPSSGCCARTLTGS